MFISLYATMERDAMRHTPIMIKKIEQVDNESFKIEWSDGIAERYRLDVLQRMCPCAQCYDPATGKRLNAREDASHPIRAAKIENVGRYAIRIHFTSGCTKGIYSFSLLRAIGKGKVHA